jgi:hypothetical protein
VNLSNTGYLTYYSITCSNHLGGPDVAGSPAWTLSGNALPPVVWIKLFGAFLPIDQPSGLVVRADAEV